MKINANQALATYRHYKRYTTDIEKSLERISTGLKLNHSGDNAAVMAQNSKIKAQLGGLNIPLSSNLTSLGEKVKQVHDIHNATTLTNVYGELDKYVSNPAAFNGRPGAEKIVVILTDTHDETSCVLQ